MVVISYDMSLIQLITTLRVKPSIAAELIIQIWSLWKGLIDKWNDRERESKVRLLSSVEVCHTSRSCRFVRLSDTKKGQVRPKLTLFKRNTQIMLVYCSLYSSSWFDESTYEANIWVVAIQDFNFFNLSLSFDLFTEVSKSGPWIDSFWCRINKMSSRHIHRLTIIHERLRQVIFDIHFNVIWSYFIWALYFIVLCQRCFVCAILHHKCCNLHVLVDDTILYSVFCILYMMMFDDIRVEEKVACWLTG